MGKRRSESKKINAVFGLESLLARLVLFEVMRLAKADREPVRGL